MVQKTKPHTHSTCEEMRKCFAGHLKKYHQKRKRQWQQWCEPRSAELVSAACSKCGCFWTGHDPAACQVIGTFNNNLHALPGQAASILVWTWPRRSWTNNRSQATGTRERRCPICEREEFHIWKECLRQAHFRETKMGEGLIKIRDGSHSAIEPYLEITGQGEEMEVTSTLPRCRYCNVKRPHHFWTECAFQKRYQIARLPCYRCGMKSPDHVPEACWTLTTDVTMEVCRRGLELRQAVMQQRQQVHLCPVCGVGIYPTGHSVKTCAESMQRDLKKSGLKFKEVEARWPHYHGDIDVSLSRRTPSVDGLPVFTANGHARSIIRTSVRERRQFHVTHVSSVGRKNRNTFRKTVQKGKKPLKLRFRYRRYRKGDINTSDNFSAGGSVMHARRKTLRTGT